MTTPLTYGMTIDGKHTFRDYGLILTTAPIVELPDVQTEYVEVTGLNGALDYSEVLTGGPRYKNREGSWSFHVRKKTNYADAVSSLANALHGKRVKIIFDDTPDYYYEGRLTFDKLASDARGRVVTINYYLDPFRKTTKNTSKEDWKWNDLFDNTIYYGTFHVSGSKWRTLINPSIERVTPVYTCSANMQVLYGGTTFELVKGDNTSDNLALAPGDNVMQFIGDGDVTINYPLGQSL